MTQNNKQEMILASKSAKLILPFLKKYYRAKFVGLENIPDNPFLGVGNHLGVHFIPESYLWMGKYHTLKNKPPMKVLVHHMFHKILAALKFPENQFGILDASPGNAERAINEGYSLTVYPGGDRENAKPYSERNEINFYDHYGYIQLALRTGVPILPVVGIGGAETLFVLSSGEKFAKKSGLTKFLKVHTWPVYWSFPFGWHVGHFPHLSIPLPSQITISVLPAFTLENYKKEDAEKIEVLKKINDEIVGLMQIELNRLAKGRVPILGKLGK